MEQEKTSEELFDLVDEQGRVIGAAPRSACHKDPRLLHRAVHVFVFNQRQQVFLQRRSTKKDIQPGKWDTSVGGHLGQGEDYETAARREAAEELGLELPSLTFLHQYLWRSAVESELVQTFRCTWEGPFTLDPEEIDDGRFFSPEELLPLAKEGELTPNLIHELKRLALLPSEAGPSAQPG